MTVRSNYLLTFVIFGASGDLTRRKLVPALLRLYTAGQLPERFTILGIARTPFTDEAFREHLREGAGGPASPRAGAAGGLASPRAGAAGKDWEAFAEHIHYLPGDATDADMAKRLAGALSALDGDVADRIFYLATAADLYEPLTALLGAAGQGDERRGARRVVIEKPFGHDRASARALDGCLHSVFTEAQVYRIDHYLAKETAQNLLFFRFANTLFEPVWTREHIANVQITAAEAVDVGSRGRYYERTGVLRDMFQSHMLQLLSLIAMEPPPAFTAPALHDETVRLMAAVRPLEVADSVRGQYRGYRKAAGVAPDSATATYGALALFIENERWRGVPFFLRSGKALDAKCTDIAVHFRCPPRLIFPEAAVSPNSIALCIEPEEGIHLRFEAKEPGPGGRTRPVEMVFHYGDHFPAATVPEAYERLLLDVILGDATLFPRSDAIAAAWGLMDPLIRAWDELEGPRLGGPWPPGTAALHLYTPGSCGPVEADALPARYGAAWGGGCGCGGDVMQATCRLGAEYSTIRDQ